MSLGGVVLLIGEWFGFLCEGYGLLFMLGLLEVGVVVLMVVLFWLL